MPPLHPAEIVLTPPRQRGAGQRLELAVLPIARAVPDGVFDAFGWCASARLTVRIPSGGVGDGRIESLNPPGFGFVLAGDAEPERVALPREVARLHVGALAAEDEWMLAPYAIDDATDWLFEARVPASSIFELAARDLAGLFWGLHDWSHFHNHGPFEERAWTEHQCDLAALTWLFDNRDVLAITGARWDRAVAEVTVVGRRRFEEERMAAPLIDAEAVRRSP